MKRFIFLAMFLLGLALSAPVVAQPAVMTTPAPKPATMTATPSAMPVALVKPMTAMTVAPVAMTPAVMAAAPKLAAMAPESGMTAKLAEEKLKVAEPKPEWKTAGFWITKVVLPILLFVFGLLVSLKVVKVAWLQWLKDKGIIAVADKVANGFEAYAKGTPAAWDDALAQALKAVVARFGELTPEQEAKVKAVVSERKEQADKKNGDA